MSVPLPEDRYSRLALTAQQQREATLDAIVAWLIEVAEGTTVLMAWEDLHWADPTTLETLGMLIEQAPAAPLLVVATYRPELTPPWPQRSHMTRSRSTAWNGQKWRRWSVIWPVAGHCPARWSIISSPSPTACRSTSRS